MGLVGLLLAPATAQECVEPLEDILSMIADSGGQFINLLDIHGRTMDGVEFDQILLGSRAGDDQIFFGFSRDGCMVSLPAPLGFLLEDAGA